MLPDHGALTYRIEEAAAQALDGDIPLWHLIQQEDARTVPDAGMQWPLGGLGEEHLTGLHVRDAGPLHFGGGTARGIDFEEVLTLDTLQAKGWADDRLGYSGLAISTLAIHGHDGSVLSTHLGMLAQLFSIGYFFAIHNSGFGLVVQVSWFRFGVTFTSKSDKPETLKLFL